RLLTQTGRERRLPAEMSRSNPTPHQPRVVHSEQPVLSEADLADTDPCRSLRPTSDGADVPPDAFPGVILRRRASPRARRTVLAVVAITVLALAWGAWMWSRRPSVRGHWDEVNRGRAYLQQGRPDLALQAVFDVRDEAPGAGEAMSVMGLSLMRIGEYK